VRLVSRPNTRRARDKRGSFRRRAGMAQMDNGRW
jgi:hypothetical protein